MKWIQLDADTPSDPRMREVIERMANQGFGGLIRIWCFIADHGKRPGWSIDSRGKPFTKATLRQAAGLSSQEFDELMQILVENGHVRKQPWETAELVIIPAMSKRASDYEKRRVRTLSGHSPKNVRQENKTVQDSTRQRAGARERSLRSPAGASGGPNGRSGSHCAHNPRCDTFAACIQRTILEAREERSRRDAQKRKS